MKLLKLITALTLIANVCVAYRAFNNTLDTGYSGVGVSYSSISGDVEGDGFGLNTTFLLDKQNLVVQAQYNYLTADKLLGVDASDFDIEAYNLTLGLGYIFELAEKFHLVPTAGYQFSEYVANGFEAGTTDGFVYGLMARYLLLENTVLSTSINFMSGDVDFNYPELDGLKTHATAYTVSISHHINEAYSVGIGYGSDNTKSDVLSFSLVVNF